MLEWDHSVLCIGQSVKYAFIEANQRLFSITNMCRILNVKPSSYYDWTQRDISNQQVHGSRCELLVKAAHVETKERYGHERFHAYLAAQGHNISQYMVRRIKVVYAVNLVDMNL